MSRYEVDFNASIFVYHALSIDCELKKENWVQGKVNIFATSRLYLQVIHPAILFEFNSVLEINKLQTHRTVQLLFVISTGAIDQMMQIFYME